MGVGSHVLVIDQGTSSTRASIIDSEGNMIGWSSREHSQIYPRPSWVEHDPLEIWSNVKITIKEAITNSGIDPKQLAAIGVTNQRETIVAWSPITGLPLHNAIVWQDKRTTSLVESLPRNDIISKTGLVPDSYFSGPKIQWLLSNVPGLRDKARRGEALFGTIDSWITWNLTRGGRELINARGGAHVTDYSNASRTMLFNIRLLDWDPELLEVMGSIDSDSLPLPLPSSHYLFGYTGPDVTKLIGAEVPVTGMVGDQQAALFGQAGFRRGSIKATYGTGTFILMNTGEDIMEPKNGLLSTIFYSTQRGSALYALEGSILIGGAAIRWVIDAGIAKSIREVEELAGQVSGNGGVYFVPALSGLGAPYWDQYARGTIIGLTRSSDARYLARAALEAVAYMARDVLESFRSVAGINWDELRVDGGASRNNLLMQFQADITGLRVVRPINTETTSLGAAYLAGLAAGLWRDLSDVAGLWRPEAVFIPRMPLTEREQLYGAWKAAVARAMGWARETPWALSNNES